MDPNQRKASEDMFNNFEGGQEQDITLNLDITGIQNQNDDKKGNFELE